jgi:hypothetical protein
MGVPTPLAGVSRLARGPRKPPRPAAPGQRVVALMEAIADLADIIASVGVMLGLVFAGIQLRQFRLSQEREAGLELLHSYQTPLMARGLQLMFALPDALCREDVETRLGKELATLWVLMVTWESLGVLVYRGQVELAMVDDFFSGPLLLSWRKLQRYVEEYRAQLQRDTMFEWFQWLAERMQEREALTPPLPAHIGCRNWRPPA